MDLCVLRRGTKALFQRQLRITHRAWAAMPDLEPLLRGPLLPQLESNEGRLCDLRWPFQLNSSVALCKPGAAGLLLGYQRASNFFSQQFKN